MIRCRRFRTGVKNDQPSPAIHGQRESMSEGFHPKARMSFPSALALGIQGADEVMEEMRVKYNIPTELPSK